MRVISGDSHMSVAFHVFRVHSTSAGRRTGQRLRGSSPTRSALLRDRCRERRGSREEDHALTRIRLHLFSRPALFAEVLTLFQRSFPLSPNALALFPPFAAASIAHDITGNVGSSCAALALSKLHRQSIDREGRVSKVCESERKRRRKAKVDNRCCRLP